mmetsp:Transcript_6786/g.10919  ORF Transcript_6786/g.10919 Transcript_6786/m.10919 type:complete len:407 (-) Transcript_6786:189-1409(-)
MTYMTASLRSAPPQRSDDGDDYVVSVNPGFGRKTQDLTAILRSEKSSKWLSVISGQRRTRDEIDRFINHHFKGPDGQGHNRLLDKITFLLTVLGCIFMTYCVASPFGRRLIPYAYLISLPVLIIIRYVQYKRRKWHYFLLDFCYWANLGCVIYILGLPSSGVFFGVMFGIVNSILPWTIIAYRNSLVFHSIDRFTSFYIHVFPMAVFYAIRWYPKDVAAWWYDDFNVDVAGAMQELFDMNEVKWWHVAFLMTFGSLVTFFVQQAIEIVWINVVARQPCAQSWLRVYVDQEYMTLFRYNLSKEDNVSYKVLNALGPNYRLFMWMVLNMAFASMTVIPAYIWFRWQYAAVAFTCYVFAIGTWNGANFYVEVFSRHYYARRMTVKPHSGKSSLEEAEDDDEEKDDHSEA